jgi:hypothetical protein
MIIKKEHVPHYQGRLKGQSHYNLIVEITPKTKPLIFGNFIQAYREKILDDQIWNDILADNYLGKKYLFTCHKHGYMYKLVRWKEITN